MRPLTADGAKDAGKGPGLPTVQDGNGGKNQDGSAAKDPKSEIDLGLKPNEAGKIMVLMYHNIGEPEAEWVRTPANFRKDLETHLRERLQADKPDGLCERKHYDRTGLYAGGHHL